MHVEYILRSSYFINFIFQCNASHFTYSTEYFGWYILCVKYIILLLNFGGNCNVTMIQCISIYICSMKSSMKKKTYLNTKRKLYIWIPWNDFWLAWLVNINLQYILYYVLRYDMTRDSTTSKTTINKRACLYDFVLFYTRFVKCLIKYWFDCRRSSPWINIMSM